MEDLLYSKGMPVGLLPAANPRISKRHLGIGARSIYLLVYMSGRYAVISNKVTCGGEPGRGAAAGCLLLLQPVRVHGAAGRGRHTEAAIAASARDR